MKILAQLLAVALIGAGLGHYATDRANKQAAAEADAKLNDVREDLAGTQEAPVCLMERTGGALVIMDNDPAEQVYLAVKVGPMSAYTVKIVARDLNVREDLKKIPCEQL